MDKDNNNFRYIPDRRSTWFNIDVRVGSYKITDINDYIRQIIKENVHYNAALDKSNLNLQANNNTIRSVLEIAPNNGIDFTTPNSVRTVLDLNGQMYSSGYNKGENLINILSVNSSFVT